MATVVTSLCDRTPVVSAQQILADLTPPPQFAEATFGNYVPSPDFPSQGFARDYLEKFVTGPSTIAPPKLFGRSKNQDAELKPGVYLDGGFGVGKTHLLAAAWHAASGRTYFGTFLQYTSLVGALGFSEASKSLQGARLICIDEFELDDPGDTMVMTRLLRELVASGTKIIATSNTPPHALGEGRFAAADFLREIQSLAGHFETIRIDGNDYRQRGNLETARVLTQTQLGDELEQAQKQGMAASADGFDELSAHLARVHPSCFSQLFEPGQLIGLTDVHPFANQAEALRFVAFIDRAYDAQARIAASGTPLSEIFPADMLSGGYRKKYLRCTSRLIAMTQPH